MQPLRMEPAVIADDQARPTLEGLAGSQPGRLLDDQQAGAPASPGQAFHMLHVTPGIRNRRYVVKVGLAPLTAW